MPGILLLLLHANEDLDACDFLPPCQTRLFRSVHLGRAVEKLGRTEG
jgi:hypothetical protein